MADSVLTEAERQFLVELNARGVDFMIVGLTAATLQGANTSTIDIDLWFADTGDARIREAANAAGGIWTSGVGLMPAGLGGNLDRFDVVLLTKDLAAIPALEEALAAIEASAKE